MKHENYYKKFIDENPYPRILKSFEPSQSSSSIYVVLNGQKLINFSSSDYLGLSRHPLLIKRSQDYVERYGAGSGASRLVSGNMDAYQQLESDLAQALHKPAALILGAGYQTNISVLEALLDASVLGEQPLVFCDRLCHVSMIASSRHLARLHRFRHNDINHLRQLLEKYSQSRQPKFILIESIYSMDGDQTNLAEMTALAKHFNALLYVDDAHSVGLYGQSGWGSATDYANDIPLIMGTFSKALGGYGSYIACSEIVKSFLVNKCRGLIYSTGLSPSVLGAISAAIELVPLIEERRERVAFYTQEIKQFFQENLMDYGQSSTHIIPWIIGDAKLTLKVTQLLEKEGILGVAIQPPTVPVGKSRIRFSLTAAHSEDDIESLKYAIKQVIKKI